MAEMAEVTQIFNIYLRLPPRRSHEETKARKYPVSYLHEMEASGIILNSQLSEKNRKK